MSRKIPNKPLSRREFLKIGGGMLGLLAGSTMLPKSLLQPVSVAKASRPLYPLNSGQVLSLDQAANSQAAVNQHLVATDGWIYLPESAAVPPYFPDDQAPAPQNMYIFGYRDVTGLSNDLVHAQKMKAQLAAPIFSIDQVAPGSPSSDGYAMKLTNLGLQMRPDLIDAHTIHFHGFRNAIPIFDGEPHSSVGVPIIRDLTYFYRAHDPGTYMYHCHFEETEHVHMGMVGVCYINPYQNQGATLDFNGDLIPAGKYVYNDLVPFTHGASTAYDRQFVMCLSEIWSEAHWCDSHIQLPEWTDYEPDFFLLNGRVYPDTMEPNGLGTDPVTGDLIAPPGRPELQYQPVSSLVKVNSGDRVLLRFANLGFKEAAISLTGIKMRVIGRDATLLRGRDGTDLSQTTHTFNLHAGESADAIFTAPTVTEKTRFLLYNRNLLGLSNGGGAGYGGQMTEVWVYPAGYLPAQGEPNS